MWKTPEGEIDFIAEKQNEKLYVQVTQELKTEKTQKREYERLLEIHDNYPKYVLTKFNPLQCRRHPDSRCLLASIYMIPISTAVPLIKQSALR